MATTKFYLDTRRASESTFALRINISQHTKTAAFPLGIKLAKSQWDSTAKVAVNHPEAKYLTNYITRRKIEVDTLLLKLEDADAITRECRNDKSIIYNTPLGGVRGTH